MACGRGACLGTLFFGFTAGTGGLDDGHGSADPRAVEEDALAAGSCPNKAERLRVLKAIGLLSSACSIMLSMLQDISIELAMTPAFADDSPWLAEAAALAP